MALDTTTPRPRRALLAAGLGGLAATIASALGRPAVVRAGADGDVVLGGSNSTTGNTVVSNTGSGDGLTGHADSGRGLWGTSATGFGVVGGSTSGVGVYGFAPSNYAVYGSSGSSNGVYGWSDSIAGVRGESGSGTGVVGTSPSIGVSGTSTTGTGVLGSSGSGVAVSGYSNATGAPAARFWSPGNSTGVLAYSGDTPPAPVANTGLFGVATQDGSARGVYGQTTSGQGVRGEATSGIGGYFKAGASGTALKTSGRVKLNRSGQASIGASKTYVDVTVPGGLAGTPLPFANLLRYHSGVYVAAIRPNYPSTGVMRIYLNQAASATVSTPVAWFVLD